VISVSARLRKILNTAVIALLLVLTACSLFACHKISDEEKDRIARNENAAAFADNFLNALDESWGVNADVKEVNDVGEFVVTRGWILLVSDTLKASSVQTSKLGALANAAGSGEGRALISDFSGNISKIIPLVKQVGFTPTDISGVVYGFMCALVEKGGDTINNMLSELTELKKNTDDVGVLNEINPYIMNLSLAKNGLVLSADEKSEMLSALEKAQAPINAITSFAYNMSVNSLSDNMLGAIFGGGALESISEDEIRVVVDALLSNVTALKSALAGDALKNLNAALGLVIDKFEFGAQYVPSLLYSQVVRYAKYADMLAGMMNAACDVVTAAGDLLKNPEFLLQFKAMLGGLDTLDDNAKSINMSIIAVKLVNEITSKFSENELVSMIDELISAAQNDYQKAVPIMGLDIALNLSSIFGRGEFDEHAPISVAHPDIMPEKDFGIMLSTVLFLNSNLDKLKEAYYEFTLGNLSVEKLVDIANWCSFRNFEEINNPYSAYTQTEQWFNYYVTTGVSIINQTIEKSMDSVSLDLKKFISDFYTSGSESSEAAKTVAGWELLSENIPEKEAEERLILIARSDIMGIAVLLSAVFGK